MKYVIVCPEEREASRKCWSFLLIRVRAIYYSELIASFNLDLTRSRSLGVSPFPLLRSQEGERCCTVIQMIVCNSTVDSFLSEETPAVISNVSLQ